ncbi:NERD domain-containing protein [Kiritimatiellaeota bacterium B1221]|nr:NERD domain-containing protein [Kiritimatiellaeota bacterium B1221]
MLLTWILILIAVFIFLSIIIAIENTPSAKGRRGEIFVSSALHRNLPSQQYTVFDNVTLPAPNGSTQIDHIVISKYGIFCIETKNMKGWIYGYERQKYWTQVIYQKRTRFQNPLRQNYSHTETLRKRLGLSKAFVHSIIVFTGDAESKTPMPPNVGDIKTCIDYIRYFKSVIFNPSEVDRITDIIISERMEPTRATHRLHVENVRNRPAQPFRQPKEHIPDCPVCGAEMILRTAKKGPNPGSQFWGCSTFPKCRQTRSIDNTDVLK